MKYLDITHNRLDHENLIRVIDDLLFKDELKDLKMTNCCPLVLTYMLPNTLKVSYFLNNKIGLLSNALLIQIYRIYS